MAFHTYEFMLVLSSPTSPHLLLSLILTYMSLLLVAPCHFHVTSMLSYSFLSSPLGAERSVTNYLLQSRQLTDQIAEGKVTWSGWHKQLTQARGTEA